MQNPMRTTTKNAFINALDSLPHLFTRTQFVNVSGLSDYTFDQYADLVCDRINRLTWTKKKDAAEIINKAIITPVPRNVRRSDIVLNNYVNHINEMPQIFSHSMLAASMGMSRGAVSGYLTSHSKELKIEHLKDGSYRKTGGKMIQPPIEQLTPETCDDLVRTFLKYSNEEKAKLVATLFPIVTEQELLAKFNELYPNYLFKDIKDGDKLFHPIAGDIEVTNVSAHKFHFYGNGKDWECDRNGRLIVNGKTNETRNVFIDIDDYVEYMKQVKSIK